MLSGCRLCLRCNQQVVLSRKKRLLANMCHGQSVVCAEPVFLRLDLLVFSNLYFARNTLVLSSFVLAADFKDCKSQL